MYVINFNLEFDELMILYFLLFKKSQDLSVVGVSTKKYM